MTNIVYSDNTPAVSFGFNRVGQQTTITDATGTRSFSYNTALQLAAETNVFGVILRSYDTLGRSSGFSMGNNYSVAYGYSDVGRFASVSSSVQSVSSVVGYSYVPNSDLLAGYSSSSGPGVSRTYEPNRNLITSIQNSFNAASVSRFDYQNDVLGRRTQRIDNSSAVNNFGYNIRSELVDASMGASKYDYGYDPIGNRLVATNNGAVTAYTADSLNQYTAINQVQPAYDLDGNLVNDGTFTYFWDAENRLIAVSNATTLVTFKYDYMSRRYSKTVNNGTPRTFLYDGWAMIQESAGTLTNSYVYGLDLSGSSQGAGTIGGILSSVLSGSSVFYSYDANGNVTDLTSSSGTSAAHYEYDPYGNTTVKTGTLADANPFRFSTKYFDAETGMYYYGRRFYSPNLGRFINRDPKKEKGGKNLYAFCKNNAVRKVDYIGLTATSSSAQPSPSALPSSSAQQPTGENTCCAASVQLSGTMGTVINYDSGQGQYYGLGLDGEPTLIGSGKEGEGEEGGPLLGPGVKVQLLPEDWVTMTSSAPNHSLCRMKNMCKGTCSTSCCSWDKIWQKDYIYGRVESTLIDATAPEEHREWKDAVCVLNENSKAAGLLLCKNSKPGCN